MALADAVKRLEKNKPLLIKGEGLCYFANVYSKFPKEDKDTLDSLVARGVSARIIVNLLNEVGYKVGLERFNDHRYNRCKCVRESK
jgi:hypothetical protein